MLRRLAPLALLFVGCLHPWADTTGTSSTTDETSSSSTTDGSSTSEGAHSSTSAEGSDSSVMTATSASSTTGDATTSDSTTTGEPPVCGDGLVNTPDEECDDGNDDAEDGCDNACARDRIVFATSEQLSPDWITGLKPADDICKQLANKAGLANPFSYTAWLSDSTADAADRIYPGKGRYLRPDGVVVAHGAQQFRSGALLAPIQTDEFGEPLVSEYVWTGTRPDGTRVPGAGHCSDWTSKSLLEKGHVGDISATNERWTFIPDPEINPTGCFLDLHLYCLEGK